MKYINNIRTGFTVKIDETTGEFAGILRSGIGYKTEKSFSGNINTMTDHEKLQLEAILQGAFPEMRTTFCQAYRTLLPNFEGFIIIVEA